MRLASQSLRAVLCAPIVLSALATESVLSQPSSENVAVIEQQQEHFLDGTSIHFPGRSHVGEITYSILASKMVVSPKSNQDNLQIQLLVCNPEQTNCYEGLITTLFSHEALAELKRHRLKSYPITLSPDVKGYLIPSEVEESGESVASVMWEEEGRFYKVQFPALERQSMLYMAHSMVTAELSVKDFLDAQVSRQYRRSSTISPAVEQFIQARSSQTSQGLLSPSASEESLAGRQTSGLFDDSSMPILLGRVSRLAEITDSRVFPLEKLGPFNEYIHQHPEKTVNDLARYITEEYVRQGYITSKVIEDGSSVDASGVLRLVAVEGDVRKLEVCWTNERRLKQSYVVERIKTGIGEPLNYNDLENSLRLLKADPRFLNIEATLRESSSDATKSNFETTQTKDCFVDNLRSDAIDLNPRLSDLHIKVTEADLAALSLEVNNYAPPSVGSEQLNATFLTRAFGGEEQSGDELQASVALTRKLGLKNLDLSFRKLLNPRQGMLEARIIFGETQVVQEPFNELEIRGTSQRYELNFRQPLIRKYDEELIFTTGFTSQSGQTFLFENLPSPFGFGPDADGRSRTSTLKLGQSYVKREPKGAWSLGSQFSLGLNLFNATVNEEPIPDGRFMSWLGLAQRSQRLGNNHLLVFQGELQLTPDSLLPSQQFVIGGAQSVRGYRQNARSGDNGFRIRLEDQITVRRDGSGRPLLQLVPFWDLGSVWNGEANPNKSPDQRFLSSLGLGMQWNRAFNLEGFTVNLDYGIPLNRLNEPEKTLQDSGFHFGMSYQRSIDLNVGPIRADDKQPKENSQSEAAEITQDSD